jgi:hypothetical protein
VSKTGNHPDRIILLVDSYENLGTGLYLSDSDIAYLLQTGLEETRKELLILEGNGLLNLKKETGPSYGARLTTAGFAKVAWLKTTPRTNIH